jgi:hypothetical protein
LVTLPILGPRGKIPSQRTPGFRSTITLPVTRALRRTWRVYERRRPCSSVLGGSRASHRCRGFLPGPCGPVGALAHEALLNMRLGWPHVDINSPSCAYHTTRLFEHGQGRRGWADHSRSLLLGRHIDDDVEELARAVTESGSRDHQPPYLARQRCRGTNPRSPMGPANRPLYGSAGERIAQRADQATERGGDTSDLPRFGPHGCVKPYSCFSLFVLFLSSDHRSAHVVPAATHAEWA